MTPQKLTNSGGQIIRELGDGRVYGADSHINILNSRKGGPQGGEALRQAVGEGHDLPAGFLGGDVCDHVAGGTKEQEDTLENVIHPLQQILLDLGVGGVAGHRLDQIQKGRDLLGGAGGRVVGNARVIGVAHVSHKILDPGSSHGDRVEEAVNLVILRWKWGEDALGSGGLHGNQFLPSGSNSLAGTINVINERCKPLGNLILLDHGRVRK